MSKSPTPRPTRSCMFHSTTKPDAWKFHLGTKAGLFLVLIIFFLHPFLPKKISNHNIHHDIAWKGKTTSPGLESLSIGKPQSILQSSDDWGSSISLTPKTLHTLISFPWFRSLHDFRVNWLTQHSLSTTVNCCPTEGKLATCSFFQGNANYKLQIRPLCFVFMAFN